MIPTWYIVIALLIGAMLGLFGGVAIDKIREANCPDPTLVREFPANGEDRPTVKIVCTDRHSDD